MRARAYVKKRKIKSDSRDFHAKPFRLLQSFLISISPSLILFLIRFPLIFLLLLFGLFEKNKKKIKKICDKHEICYELYMFIIYLAVVSQMAASSHFARAICPTELLGHYILLFHSLSSRRFDDSLNLPSISFVFLIACLARSLTQFVHPFYISIYFSFVSHV